jgi:RNA polymerase sigma factor (sigma-70 family)
MRTAEGDLIGPLPVIVAPARVVSLTLRSELHRLLEKHRSALKQQASRFCKGNPDEAEDLVQDVCEYAMSRGAQLLEHPNPRAWLFTVLNHRFIDYCRSGKRSPLNAGELGTEVAEEDMRLSHFMNRNWIERGIGKLPLHLGAVIRLRLQDLEIRVIGERLRISTSEAGKRLQEACTLLRQFRDEEEEKW